MKYFYVDVETSGLDPFRHAILQIAAIIEKDDKKEETFKATVAPFPNDILDPVALNVGGFTEEQIKGFKEPKEVYLDLKDLLNKYVDPYNKQDKFFFVGYNSNSFDMPFVRRLFEKNNDSYFGSYFFYPSIDVMILAAEALKKKRKVMPNFKLETVAKEIGVEFDKTKLHDALYDIEVTREVYKRLK